MELKDLNRKSLTNASKALKEHFGVTINFSKLSLAETKQMLSKVRKLVRESRLDKSYYHSENNPAFIKLMVMEQALSSRYAEFKDARIVVESEEVGQAQVVMAAQDMVDRLQKMIEDVSDMLVKELPAVTDSIRAQFGMNESDSFNQQSADTLRSLADALTQAKTGMQGALGTITGEGAPTSFDAGADEMPEMGDEMPEMGDEMPAPDMPEEEPESQEDFGALGRGRR